MKKIFIILSIITLALQAAQNGRLVAEWDFGKSANSDAAGKFTGGKVRGRSTIVDGWLTMTPGYDDKQEGFATSEAAVPELSPTGGFRFEAVAKVRGEHNGDGTYTIVDSKYLRGSGVGNSVDNNRGFAWILIASKDNPRIFTFYAQLGCEGVTHVVTSDKVELEADKEYTFAAEYDGRTSFRFYLDGKDCGGRSFEGGPIVTPIRPLIIGDRFGSLQHRFNGQIKNVKLYEFPAQTFKVFQGGRLAFTRGEVLDRKHCLGLSVLHFGDDYYPSTTIDGMPISTFKCEMYVDGKRVASPVFSMGPPDPKYADTTKEGGKKKNNSATFQISLPEHLGYEVGEHPYRAVVKLDTDKGVVSDEFNGVVSIGPMPPPDTFPVVVWNAGAIVPDLATMVENGITHDHADVDKYGLDKRDSSIVQSEVYRKLDNYVAKGVKHAGYFTFAHNGTCIKKYPRYNVNGEPVVKNIEASNPAYQEEARALAEKTARMIGKHPGFGALLINSEVRDSSSPSFGKFEPAAFEKFAGYPIPPSVVAKGYDNYRNVSGFPLSRIIPDDDRILTYYRWFWKGGDGWNKVHSIVNDEFHKVIDGDFWTFFDPAVRTPPIWGSGGSVDVINQWTYAYPDPIRIAVATDELFAMAKGRPGQKVMTMTQLI